MTRAPRILGMVRSENWPDFTNLEESAAWGRARAAESRFRRFRRSRHAEGHDPGAIEAARRLLSTIRTATAETRLDSALHRVRLLAIEADAAEASRRAEVTRRADASTSQLITELSTLSRKLLS